MQVVLLAMLSIIIEKFKERLWKKFWTYPPFYLIKVSCFYEKWTLLKSMVHEFSPVLSFALTGLILIDFTIFHSFGVCNQELQIDFFFLFDWIMSWSCYLLSVNLSLSSSEKLRMVKEWNALVVKKCFLFVIHFHDSLRLYCSESWSCNYHACNTDSPIYFSDDMFLYEVKLIQCKAILVLSTLK